MQIPGEAAPLRQPLGIPLVETGCYLPLAPSVNAPEEAGQYRANHYKKPVGFIEHRGDAELECGSIVVPNAIVVARCDSKSVRPGREVCIRGCPSTYRPVPFTVIALELVPKEDALWRGEAEGGKSEVNVSCAGREMQC